MDFKTLVSSGCLFCQPFFHTYKRMNSLENCGKVIKSEYRSLEIIRLTFLSTKFFFTSPYFVFE